jgi:hypothetical protein
MSARSSSNEIANEPQNESSVLVGEIDAEGNSSILEGNENRSINKCEHIHI